MNKSQAYLFQTLKNSFLKTSNLSVASKVGATQVKQVLSHKRSLTALSGTLMMAGLYQFQQSGIHILYSSTGPTGGSGNHGNQTPQGGNQGPSGDNSGLAAAHQNKDEQIKINEHIDQTILKGNTRWEDVQKVCNEALTYHFVAVCIPPAFVKQARAYLTGSPVKIATVIGFPFGNTTTEVKVFETIQAIENGADEIDMVINVGWLKSGLYDSVGHEISEIKKACGDKILKVIVETGYLTEDEIKRVTEVVDRAGADFIKTSTGFGPRGASYRDVELFREVSKRLKIKAAGGVRDKQSAEKYIKMGVSRIGTSTGMVLLVDPKPEDANKQPGSY